MPRVTEVLSRFLADKMREHPGADLVQRYLDFGGPAALETQVNVAAGEGEPVEGRRHTWSDGVDTWWNIRIPKKANAEPEWDDYELRYPLAVHADGIGSTGWDWRARCSRWVGFDFDSITDHAAGVGISKDDLKAVLEAAKAIPYVEARRSTGGKGWHLYVHLDAIPTANHTEHAALARCILGMMSTAAGFDFAAKVDCCGSILWIWHRKLQDGGLSLVKAAEKTLGASDLPPNWRDHLEVVTKKRSKVRVNGLPEGQTDPFDVLTSSRRIIPLDDKHKAVIQALMETGRTTVWVDDHHLLQTHTTALKRVAEEMGIIGPFETTSAGRDPGQPNCFCFPLADGAWRVYRFGQGVVEAPTWEQDGEGWTTCGYNCLPTLEVACRACGGLRDPDKGEWVFSDAADAVRAASMLGQTLNLPEGAHGREARLRLSKDRRLVIYLEKIKGDARGDLPGWLMKKDRWVHEAEKRLDLSDPSEELGFNEFDNKLRCLDTPSNDPAGWAICKSNGRWVRQPLVHVRALLPGMGVPKTDVEPIVGQAVDRSWELVNLPFYPEYPGGRQWNFDAAQFRYQPAQLVDDEAPHHPHWDMILSHLGRDLDAPLKDLVWAQQTGIKTGAHYLTAWIASMFREPFEPLPYLFAYGSENCGKSIFHEAIDLLVTKGVVSADRALTSTNDFNGELANAVLCVVEEKNVAASKTAHARIKEWATGKTLSIRKMRSDSYKQPNTTHWFQAANRQEYCPVFPGDTRIVVMYVDDLLPEQEVPKKVLLERLAEEGPHFMYTLMNLELPPVGTRTRIPVVVTNNKLRSQEFHQDELEEFIAECCVEVQSATTLFKDFYERFYEWLPVEARAGWSRQKVNKALPTKYPTWNGTGNKKMIGNLNLKDNAEGEEGRG